jgi:hypothetical protein
MREMCGRSESMSEKVNFATFSLTIGGKRNSSDVGHHHHHHHHYYYAHSLKELGLGAGF